jgi:hypothetical protein
MLMGTMTQLCEHAIVETLSLLQQDIAHGKMASQNALKPFSFFLHFGDPRQDNEAMEAAYMLALKDYLHDLSHGTTHTVTGLDAAHTASPLVNSILSRIIPEVVTISDPDSWWSYDHLFKDLNQLTIHWKDAWRNNIGGDTDQPAHEHLSRLLDAGLITAPEALNAILWCNDNASYANLGTYDNLVEAFDRDEQDADVVSATTVKIMVHNAMCGINGTMDLGELAELLHKDPDIPVSILSPMVTTLSTFPTPPFEENTSAVKRRVLGEAFGVPVS